MRGGRGRSRWAAGGWWKRANIRTFWDQVQSSSTAFVRMVEESKHQNVLGPAPIIFNCFCHWSAQPSSTRSLGGSSSPLQALSLVSQRSEWCSYFFNKIFGRNFVIIAVFVTGHLNLLQQDLWEEFCHHCCLCLWSAQPSSTRSLGGISSSLQALSVVSEVSE